jgi:hypothetical protein
VTEAWVSNELAHAGPEHLDEAFRWLLEPMLAAAGFDIVSVAFERRLYGAYICVKSR